VLPQTRLALAAPTLSESPWLAPSVAARRARKERVRVFDAAVAMTYTAAGCTDAWQTAPYGRDRRQPRAWLLDTCV